MISPACNHVPLEIPQRRGPRPTVTGHVPQVQLDQLEPSLREHLLDVLRTLPGVRFGASRRAPPGTVGLHLDDFAAACSDDFLIDREFAHVHPGGDGSMHLVLPEPLRSMAIAAGWALPHPLAGLPTVSPGTVMVYAPRTHDELDAVTALVVAAWRNACGLRADAT